MILRFWIIQCIALVAMGVTIITVTLVTENYTFVSLCLLVLALLVALVGFVSSNEIEDIFVAGAAGTMIAASATYALSGDAVALFHQESAGSIAMGITIALVIFSVLQSIYACVLRNEAVRSYAFMYGFPSAIGLLGVFTGLIALAIEMLPSYRRRA